MKRRREQDRAFEHREVKIERLDLQADMGPDAPLSVYRMGHCTIYAGQTPWGWHLAVSHPSRYPTWAEVIDARYHVIPESVTMAMILPPERSYTEIHPNMLQLWQVKQEQIGRRTNA